MDFNGTWQVYSQENYEEFLRAMGEKNTRVSCRDQLYYYIIIKVAILTWLAHANIEVDMKPQLSSSPEFSLASCRDHQTVCSA